MDLRSKTASVSRACLYWPWPKVRVSSRREVGDEKLVLRRGLRRIIARVPPERREAVDRVLSEKLAHGAS